MRASRSQLLLSLHVSSRGHQVTSIPSSHRDNDDNGDDHYDHSETSYYDDRVSNDVTLSLNTARQHGIEKCVEKMLNFAEQLRRLKVRKYKISSILHLIVIVIVVIVIRI